MGKCSLLLIFLLTATKIAAQCDFTVPVDPKTVQYASREFTFLNVNINGTATTYLEVEKGAQINVSVDIQARRKGDYCPDCIVQVYWGIRGHTSTCAKSFYGYRFEEIRSAHSFRAPMQDGIYYITMGGTLDYYCKNHVNRPDCPAEKAFAVLKVGNPKSNKKVSLRLIKENGQDVLQTAMISTGCFTNLDKIEWYLDAEKLSFDNQTSISPTQSGKYRVLWSNCHDRIEEEFDYSPHTDSPVYTINLKSDNRNAQESIKTDVEPIGQDKDPEPFKIILKPNADPIPRKETSQTEILEELVKNNDRFVLEHLIFDLGKYQLKQEAKEELEKLAEIMKSNPAMRILLEGHTDRRGGANENLKLSEKRVKSARTYLVQQGIPRNNIAIKGWGHEKPLVITTDIEEGRINRRVEVTILAR